jgi:alpha-L-fucosidase
MGDTSWFTRGRFGMMLHWGAYSVAGIEASWPMMRGDLSYARLEELARQFKPTAYDPEAWACLAKEAGACYVVLTTKHHEGFALWDSQLSDFTAPRWAGTPDLIKPYADAVRAAGLKVGFYFSLPDWHHPDYPVTPTILGTRPEQARPPGYYTSIEDDPARWQRYLDFMHGQLEELMTNYGQVDEIWFDGGWEHTVEEWQGRELMRKIRQWQPQVIVNDRLNPPREAVIATKVDPELSDYIQPEMALPAPVTTDPWERVTTIADSWSWKPDDYHYKSAATLVRQLVQTVSEGGVMLLDFGPRADGSVAGAFSSRLRVVGDWLQRNQDSIVGAGPAAGGKSDALLTSAGDRLFVHVVGAPPEETVTVEGLVQEVTDVRLLDGGRPLQWEQTLNPYYGSYLKIQIPERLQDPLGTVLAVTLSDKPLAPGPGLAG